MCGFGDTKRGKSTPKGTEAEVTSTVIRKNKEKQSKGKGKERHSKGKGKERHPKAKARRGIPKAKTRRGSPKAKSSHQEGPGAAEGQRAKAICHNCGRKGHYASECLKCTACPSSPECTSSDTATTVSTLELGFCCGEHCKHPGSYCSCCD